ncbi:MAG: flagellar hook-basal body complex protein FliE [Candidatus Sericytochromatia bacterium]
MGIYTSAVDGLNFENSKVNKSQMPLSFENKSVEKSSAAEPFVELLNGVVDDFEHRNKLTLDMLSGKDVDVHALMIAQAQVDMVSNLASTITTKISTAYQTLMNMQV